ncbi:MAG: RsmG family class I SAM-dependent methyltransferase [Polyangiaceae bacterium]
MTWMALVEDYNRRIDLTAARDTDALCDLLLADAAWLAARLPRDASVVDVGTGAGAPGMAVALLRADLTVTLVEPLQKRVATLRAAIGRVLPAFGAARAPLLRRERGEDLVKRAETFEVALSRATLPPPEWLALGARLAPQGSVWVLLAEAEAPVLDGWAAAEDETYRWPLTDRVRRAVRYAPV